MSSENDLMQKLMISKKIMDRHNQMDKNGETPKGDVYNIQKPVVEEFQPVNGQYNIPQEFMVESKPISNPTMPTKDRILSSKLPDEIKRLMIENPIAVPNTNTNITITNELAEKASRLMNIEKSQPIQQQKSQVIHEQTDLRSLMKEVLTEILQENGLLIESQNKSNDNFTFRVGQHIFEGKVTKIKKIRKS